MTYTFRLTELHVYAQGGHGFGVRKSTLPGSTWTDHCVAWLHNMGLLGTTNDRADASRAKLAPRPALTTDH